MKLSAMILPLLVSLAFIPVGEAKKPAPVLKVKYPRLLTHRQIESMGPRQRSEYMRQVRLALVQIEAMQIKLKRALGPTRVADENTLRKMFAQLSFFEKAYAAPARPKGIPYVVTDGEDYFITCDAPLLYDAVANLCYSPAERSDQLIKCANGQPPLVHTGLDLKKVYTCVSAEAFNNMQTQIGRQALSPEEAAKGISIPSGKPSSPDGTYLTKADAFNAISTRGTYDSPALDTLRMASVETLPQASAAPVVTNRGDVVPVVEKGLMACSNNADGKYTYNSRYGTCVKTIGGACEAGEGVTIHQAGSTTTNCIPKSSYDKIPKERQAAICSEAGTELSSDSNTPKKCVAPSDLASLTRDESIAQYGADAAGTEASAGESEAPTEIQATGGTCEWKDLACKDPTPSKNKELRRTFRKGHDAEFLDKNFSICMFAGNFSTYVDDKAASGQCLPPNQMGAFKCAAGKEVLCNPVVFGLKDGKAICTPSKGDSTRTCSSLVPETFEPANELAGEDWDEFAKSFETNFKAYCLPGVDEGKFEAKFQDYFCHECNVVGKTIMDANKPLARTLNLCEAPEKPPGDGGEDGDGDGEPPVKEPDRVPGSPAMREEPVTT